MLKRCLDYVREGDALVVSHIDRLARSTLHLCRIAETLREKGVDLVVLASETEDRVIAEIFIAVPHAARGLSASSSTQSHFEHFD